MKIIRNDSIRPSTAARPYGWSALSAAMLATALLGCQEMKQQEWSSREQSTRPLAIQAPSLSVVSVEERSEDTSAVRATAIDILTQAARSSEPLLRANAIEAMSAAPEHAGAVLRDALGDENRGVRFVAAMTVGRLRMQELHDVVAPLALDPSPSVRAGALYALDRLGAKPDLSPLSEMVRSSDPEVKANAALVLGELGNPSAIPLLKDSLGEGTTRMDARRAKLVDLQVAEAMVKLGRESEIEVIRAAMFSPPDQQSEVSALAVQMAGRLQDRRMAPKLLEMATQPVAVGTKLAYLPAEIRMAATTALAEMEHDQVPVEVALEFASADRPAWRALAALSLGATGDHSALPVLSRLLSDQEPLVQVAAAASVLRIAPAIPQPFDTAEANGTAAFIDTNR